MVFLSVIARSLEILRLAQDRLRNLPVLLAFFLLTSCPFGGGSKTETGGEGVGTEARGEAGSTADVCSGSAVVSSSESSWNGSVTVASGVVSSPTVSLNLSAHSQAKVTAVILSEDRNLISSPSRGEGEGGGGWIPLAAPTTDFSQEVTYALSAGDGAKTVYVWFKNECGDISPSASVVLTLDTGKPTGALTLAGGAATTSSLSVAVKVTGSGTTPIIAVILSEDRNLIPSPSRGESEACPEPCRRGGGDISWLPLDPSTAVSLDTTFSLTPTSGTHTVYGWLKTESGTISEVFSDTVEVVITAPTAGITINEGAKFTNARTVSLNLSGLGPNAITQYGVGESPSPPWGEGRGEGEAITISSPSTVLQLSAVSFQLSATDGLKTVYLHIRDSSGATASASASITLDTTPPTASIILDGGAKLTVDATVSASVTGTDNIGVVGYLLSSDSTVPSPSRGQGEGGPSWTPIVSTPAVILSGSEGSPALNITLTGTLKGLKTHYLWLKDGAGNVSATASDGIEMVAVYRKVVGLDDGQYSSIAVDSSNRAYISVYGNTDNALLLYPFSNGQWGNIRFIDGGGAGTAIAIDSSDKIHIAYRDTTNNSLKYATNASGTWVKETVEGGGNRPSIAVDRRGSAHIVHHGDCFRYVTNGGGSWEGECVWGRTGYSTTDIIVEPSGIVHVTGIRTDVGSPGYYGRKSMSWSLWEISPDAGGPSMAMYADDQPWFVYLDGRSLSKRLARLSGNQLTYETVVDRTCGCDKMVIDSLGRAHIIYNLADVGCDFKTKHLMYASNITGEWKSTTLDGSNRAGEYCDLAIDKNDRLHISYYDATNTDLKYATTAD